MYFKAIITLTEIILLISDTSLFFFCKCTKPLKNKKTKKKKVNNFSYKTVKGLNPGVISKVG